MTYGITLIVTSWTHADVDGYFCVVLKTPLGDPIAGDTSLVVSVPDTPENREAYAINSRHRIVSA